MEELNQIIKISLKSFTSFLKENFHGFNFSIIELESSQLPNESLCLEKAIFLCSNEKKIIILYLKKT